ncbi:MAG: hypothetical protein GDA56_20785 [Hormoscilla sp. GM7CHS1pb]|nr:hypothetical protein [Hormoscilla sp. GM7CHS1pb]
MLVAQLLETPRDEQTPTIGSQLSAVSSQLIGRGLFYGTSQTGKRVRK